MRDGADALAQLRQSRTCQFVRKTWLSRQDDVYHFCSGSLEVREEADLFEHLLG